MSISNRILDTMAEKNISYGELATLTKIPKSALQRYATGATKKIPIDRVKTIARAMGISSKWLLGWEDQNNAAPSARIVHLTEVTNTTSSARIRRAREISGLTQKELAEKMGCAPELLYQYEKGLQQPDDKLLKKFAEVLCVPLEFLTKTGLFSNWEEAMEHRVELCAAYYFHYGDEVDKSIVRRLYPDVENPLLAIPESTLMWLLQEKVKKIVLHDNGKELWIELIYK